MRLGIDLMGSDHPPHVLVSAISSALELFPGVAFVPLLTKEAFQNLSSFQQKKLDFSFATQVIEKEEDPLQAIREKRESTLLVGLKLLKEEKIDAFLSAGNTGALIAASSITLPRFKTLKRAPLLATFPTKKGSITLLDVGGHVACKAKDLIQFAKLGVAYHHALSPMSRPKIALLNIGAESKKGTKEVREAYAFLTENSEGMRANFIGNVEAQDLFNGHFDVLVTDGFTGNILLKTSEGLSAFILKEIGEHLPERAALHRLFDHEEYGGAMVAGLDHLVIKCHGRSSAAGFLSAIKKAIVLIKEEIIVKMKQEFLLNP